MRRRRRRRGRRRALILQLWLASCFLTLGGLIIPHRVLFSMKNYKRKIPVLNTFSDANLTKMDANFIS